MITKRAAMAFKTESVIGTAESLAATDGDINCFAEDGAFQPNIPFTVREEQGGFFKLPAVGGPRSVRLTFETDVVGTGASGAVSTELASLIKCCGYTQAGSVFTPTSVQSSMTTVTAGFYLDGLKCLAVGCMGNLGVRVSHGQINRFIFSLLGKYGGETDVALITPTFAGSPIPPRGAASVSMSGITTGLTDQMVFDKGNVLKLRESLVDVTGWHSALITNDAATVTANPETLLVASLDVDAALFNSTEAALSVTMGSTSNNTIAVAAAANKAQLIAALHSSREGLAVRTKTFNLNRAFTLTFS